MTKLHGGNTARFSMLISDCCQGLGIGAEIVRTVISIARQEKMECLEAIMTQDNEAMKRLCEKNGFQFSQDKDDLIKATLIL